MRPQQRGREFQKLFARIVGLSGWSYEEGVRTSHEEIDLIVHKNRDYYLIECKWEKEPIEGPVVRELYGKLGNRTDIRGVLVSMSGFTSGAVKQVQDFANANLILLFGQEDVNALISGKSSFEDFIGEKHHQLVTRRIVHYS
jgi:restriction endonuclease Mrr